MAKWIELYDTESDSVVYVNMDQASAIYPREKKGGSEIWFLEHPVEAQLGRIRVQQSPEEILQLLSKK